MEGVRGSNQENGMSNVFEGSVGLIQRVKPNYRVPFFNELASRCAGGFFLAAGQPLDSESIPDDADLSNGRFKKIRNTYFKDPSRSAFLCYQNNLTKWLLETNPSVLIIEANFRYLSSNAAIRWMTTRGRPVIGWGLGAKEVPGVVGKLRNNFLSQFNALIAYSTIGAQEYARTGFDRKDIFIAKNAVISSPKDGIRRRKVEDRPIRILFVGRLQPRKNVDRLIQAVGMIDEPKRPVLHIVGDGPEMGPLRKLAGEILPSAVFTGHLEGAELENEFFLADLFVLPGTGGLAVQQAIAYGLPVIVERGDGTQNDLVTQENGWLLEGASVTELTRVLEEAIDGSVHLDEMGARSFQIARDEINIQTMADVFVSALEHVASEKKA